MLSRFTKFAFLSIFVGLLILPRLVEGSLYFACCDDTRLYYIFPLKYIENYAKNLITDNTWAGANTGYFPGSQMIPLLLFIATLKILVPVNTQYLMYGLNLSLAFVFTYHFIGIWIKKFPWTKMISSLFYVFSPFLIRTVYLNQLIGIHLIWALPATLYLFTKSVLEKKVAYLLGSVFIFSVFTAGMNSLPFFVPIIITSIPLFIYLMSKHTKTTSMFSVLFILCYLLLNIHWIFHFLNSIFGSTGLGGIVGNYSSEEFIKENIRGVMGASTLFSPLNQPLVDLDLNLVKSITPSRILNLVFVLLISISGTLIRKKEISNYRGIYLLLTLSWLASWFLISPNFDKWGPQLFLLLATKIPGFTMFRNMFDKFAQPLAFYYAVTLGISLASIFSVYKNKFIQVVTLATLTIVIFTNGRSRFVSYDIHEGIAAKVSGEFNDDFNQLVNHLKNEPNASRFLWLPLNYPTYVSVEDKHNSGHFYSGLSPLRYLANRQDYAGGFSFMVPQDIYLYEKVTKLITDKKYSDVGQLMQLLNARYVILDKQVFPERMQLFLYGAQKNYLSMQTDEFFSNLLGKKIADFGNRYSLYEINPIYLSDRIYLTEDPDVISTQTKDLTYKKIDSNSFQIDVSNLNDKKYLVLLDPYYKEWTLYLTSPDGTKLFTKGGNVIIKNYANGWELDPEFIKNNFSEKFYNQNSKGSLSFQLFLHFDPQKFDKYLYPIMVGSHLLIMVAFLVLMFKPAFKNDQ